MKKRAFFLLLGICFLFMSPAWVSADDIDLSFEQLNWFGLATQTPNSSWGRVTIDFTGYSEIQYMNLKVNNKWAVQNMGIGSLFGPGIRQSLTTFFDLNVPHGTDVSTLDYMFSLSDEPMADFTVGTSGTASVKDLDYQIGGEGGVDLGTPEAVDRGSKSTAKVVKSAKLRDLDKFVNQEQKANECVPGAISNSLKYLQATKKISSTIKTGIQDIRKIVGTDAYGTDQDWYKKKQKHFEGVLITKFIEGLLPADIDNLIKELKKGEDVELDLDGHAATVVGVRVKKDGKIELDIFDDNQKADGVDKMRTVTIVNGKIDGMAFQRFVTESPVPEPTTLFLVGSGLVCLAAYRRRRSLGS